MALSPTPPLADPIQIKRGSSGWVVYSVQRAVTATPDGVFGAQTEARTKEFQLRHGLKADGVVGPKTQEAVGLVAIRVSERQIPTPAGLLRGLVLSESAFSLGAVNWKVAGGVDCSLVQRRVYGPPFNLDRLKEAFDPTGATLGAALDLSNRAKVYGGNERGWRLAAMAHNWPTGADYMHGHDKCSDPDAPCSWLPRDANGRSIVRFPDGAPVETRWDWCQFYAMGGPHGEGMVCRFVQSWDVGV